MMKANRRNTRKTRTKRQSLKKEETFLGNVAESLGSTLGVIVAKAGAARNALRTRKVRSKRRLKKV